jgi:hypothetical protein
LVSENTFGKQLKIKNIFFMMEREYLFYKIVDKESRECLYVGKTIYWSKRKGEHKKSGYLNEGREMVEIYKKLCDAGTSQRIEQSWIDHFTPKLNKNRAKKYIVFEGNYYRLSLEDVLKARGLEIKCDQAALAS